MKAAVLTAQGSLQVTTVPDPHPNPGEALVRVRNCGVCGSDIHAARLASMFPPNTIMGHEFSGEIAALGDGVRGWSIGERVVSLPYMACGACPACRRGDGMWCADVHSIGLGDLPGAYAEYVRVDPKSLLRIPDHLSFREAALAEPLAVGLRGVRRSRLREGMTCVVMGGGPIGLVTLLWTRVQGAATVVVSEPVPARQALARQLGATVVVDPGVEDPAARAQSVGGRGPDVIFECVGAKGTLAAAMAMAPVHGEVIVLGACMEPDEVMPVTGVLKELALFFVLGYSRPEFEEAVDAIATRRFDVGPLITDIVPIDELGAAFASLSKPTAQGKVLVEL